jgi:hypothetical protein
LTTGIARIRDSFVIARKRDPRILDFEGRMSDGLRKAGMPEE